MSDDVVVELRVWQTDRVVSGLTRMATGRRHLRHAPGLRFGKLLGTGSGRTLTPRGTDLHHWALLTVWEDATAATAAAQSSLITGWETRAAESLRVRMRPLKSRGRWAGVDPFPVPAASAAAHRGEPWRGPVAAITRARLRPTRAMSFWRSVPPVVATLTPHPGLRFALGIGEAPVGLQGTFSLWNSEHDLTDFAYRSPAHRSAIRRTAPERWYAEELFARFAVTEVDGRYEGRTP